MVNANQAVIDEAVADVTRAKGVAESATVLINKLLTQVAKDAQDLADAGVDVTALQATLAGFSASVDPLAAAVAANP